MDERFAQLDEVELCYQTFGDPGERPLLLVMGLGGQLILWPDEFCRLLVERGFFVVRYDNRDCGRSTSFDGAPEPDFRAIMMGDDSSAPYSLDEMADDAAGLIDHLGIDAAHVVGASLGGVIAQTLAIRHPDRVRSLCSIMSTTGDRSVGVGSPKAGETLFTVGPSDRAGYVEHALAIFRIVGSPPPNFDEARMRDTFERSYDRGLNRPGTTRQLAAVLAQPDRTPALRELDVPAVVVHGAADPLIDVSGGVATAEAIPGAELIVIEGMGHDFTAMAWPRIVDAVDRVAS